MALVVCKQRGAGPETAPEWNHPSYLLSIKSNQTKPNQTSQTCFSYDMFVYQSGLRRVQGTTNEKIGPARPTTAFLFFCLGSFARNIIGISWQPICRPVLRPNLRRSWHAPFPAQARPQKDALLGNRFLDCYRFESWSPLCLCGRRGSRESYALGRGVVANLAMHVHVHVDVSSFHISTEQFHWLCHWID